MVQLLVDNGADVNQVNLNGATALLFAATFGQEEIARILLSKQADQTISDSQGKTALNHARLQENRAMIELLNK
jgi:ankyrin repeat protein